MKPIYIVTVLSLVFALNATAELETSPIAFERNDIRNAKLIASPGDPIQFVLEFTAEKAATLDDRGYANNGVIVEGVVLKAVEGDTLLFPKGASVTTSAHPRRFKISPPNIEAVLAIMEALSEPDEVVNYG